MFALTSASAKSTRPPPSLEASTEPFTVVFEVTVMSRPALRTAEPMSTRPVLEMVRCDSASPIDIYVKSLRDVGLVRVDDWS